MSLRFSGAGNEEIADNLWITDGDEEELIFAAPLAEVLNLVVNKTTGEISIENNTGGNVDISAYSISSATGMLSTCSAQGDFNANGVVDGGDYALWRDNLGGDSAVLNGNGSGGATVTNDDYDLWVEHFGETGGGEGGWDSLAERATPEDGFPQGSGNGLGWEEGANPSQFELEEYRLVGHRQSPQLPSRSAWRTVVELLATRICSSNIGLMASCLLATSNTLRRGHSKRPPCQSPPRVAWSSYRVRCCYLPKKATNATRPFRWLRALGSRVAAGFQTA